MTARVSRTKPRELRLRLREGSSEIVIGDGLVGPGFLSFLRARLGVSKVRRSLFVADRRFLAQRPRLAARIGRRCFLVQGGERQKGIAAARRLWRELARREVLRDGCLVAIGGGVTLDLAGFVASTYMRGIETVLVPTTPLAMADAAVGGKTGVNLPEGKNLVGTFHQPRLVIVDRLTARSLPRRSYRSGLVELVKAALLEGGSLWRSVVATEGISIPLDPHLLEAAIAFKVRVVGRDEREAGERRILNLGHTLGHALEAATNYRHYLHGEAVAVGLVFSALLSERIYGFDSATTKTLATLLRNVRRPTPPGVAGYRDIRPFLSRDKKGALTGLSWVLLKAPGRPKIRDRVPASAIAAALRRTASMGFL